MIFDGASRARTDDLCHAMAALSQLSYGPVAGSKCSREVEIISPGNASPLVVSRGVQSEANLLPLESRNGQKEAAIELVAIRGEGINLLWRVEAPNQARFRPAT